VTLTVRELLAAPNLRLELLVAADLGREIRWIHTTEMPDPAPYLEGHEVVLTGGVWYWSGMPPAAFVDGLRKVEVAAIGFGVNVLVPECPGELVDACRDAGISLFLVPSDVPFMAIAHAFVQRFLEDRERPLSDAIRRNERLTKVMVERRGIEGLLSVLRADLHRDAAVVSTSGRVLGGSSPPATANAIVGLLAAQARRAAPGKSAANRPVDVAGVTAFPVVTDTARLAYLLLEGPRASLTIRERAVVDQVVAFVAVDLQRHLAIKESERRFVAELFDVLPAGEEQATAIAARLSAFDLPPDGEYVGLVCDAENRDDALVAAEAAFEALGLRGLAAVKGLDLVGIVEFQDGQISLSDLASRMLEALGPRTAVGVGTAASGAAGLRRTLIEARQTRAFAQKSPDVRAAVYTQIGSHALLLAAQDESVLNVFRNSLIDPLALHDQRRHTDLVSTLDVFLGSGGKYRATADALHIHVNTLRLRLARIEELTGRRLEKMEDRVDFFLALRATT
jgi:PucR family transcriptional regulator, purine catabolism regulatory protein